MMRLLPEKQLVELIFKIFMRSSYLMIFNEQVNDRNDFVP